MGSIELFRRPKVDLYPPVDAPGNGIRTLPELIEWNAINNPDYLFAVQPRKDQEALKISNQQLKHAILHCQKWMRASVAEIKLPYRLDKIVKGLPVAVLLENEIGLWIHLASLWSLGVPVLLLSARLSPAAIAKLLKDTKAVALLVSQSLRRNAEEALATFEDRESTPSVYAQVSTEEWLDRVESEKFDLTESICSQYHRGEPGDSNVLILHSSGTTGLPKAIRHSHKFLLLFADCHNLPPLKAEGLNVSSLPLFHGFGLIAPVLALSIGKTLCMPPKGSLPTARSILQLCKKYGARSLMTVPSILDDVLLMKDEEGIETLQNLDFVAFGGSPLKASVGDALEARGVKLLNHYGVAEVGPLSLIFSPGKDYNWRYGRLRSDLPMDIIEVYSQLPEQRYKLSVHPVDGGPAFEIQDQLVKNEKTARDFTAAGRDDDIIVLATGEKVLPRLVENALTESSLVRGALVFGAGRSEVGVLVEPREAVDLEGIEDFKDRLWPIIQSENQKMDAHARVASKEAVLITTLGKPLPRSDKGSIMRREAYKAYDTEISEVYSTLEKESDNLQEPLSLDNLEEDIKSRVQSLNWKIPANQWTVDQDFFELGMDSLQATRLRRLLMTALSRGDNSLIPSKSVEFDFVYQYPSVRQLVQALRSSQASMSNELLDSVDRFVELYSLPKPNILNDNTNKATVVLTGATGSLGAHILAQLVSLPTVQRVVCLNRPSKGSSTSDGLPRQRKSCEAKEIRLSESEWAKVSAFETDCSLDMLGLQQDKYEELVHSVTHIIHNAWPMDFMRKLASFQSQFKTLQNLLSLAVNSTHGTATSKSRFLFISSIAVVGNYKKYYGGSMVPETPMIDERSTRSIGYGQAKLVCEKIVEEASVHYGDRLEAMIARCGQITGSSETGVFNPTEHLPLLLQSSWRIGSLPELNGTLSWLPADVCAKTMAELVFSRLSPSLVYHVENPVRQSWHDMLLTIASQLGLRKDFLPFKEWLAGVEAASESKEMDNPAKALLPFFRSDFEQMATGEVVMDTSMAKSVSQALRNVDIVDRNLTAAYIKSWKTAGLFGS